MVTEKTCAACDYKLDGNSIAVRIGGKTVEVCCEECAVKLREAHAAAAAQASKSARTSTLALIGACLFGALGAASFDAHASEAAAAAVNKIAHPALTARFNGTLLFVDEAQATNAPAAACRACRAR